MVSVSSSGGVSVSGARGSLGEDALLLLLEFGWSVSSGGVLSVSGPRGSLGEDATPPGVWFLAVSSGAVVSVYSAGGSLGEDATPPPDPTPGGV